MPRAKKIWADPNREGKKQGRPGQRYCVRCGNTVHQARILKSLNLCEFCLKEFESKRDGIHSCRGCGQVVSQEELREHQGYCSQCVCPACGRPDPQQVRKTGLCSQCSRIIGDFCRICGKEAAAQVRKNRGLCDSCASQKAADNTRQQEPRKSGERKDSWASSRVTKPGRRLVGKSGLGKGSRTAVATKPGTQSFGQSGVGKAQINPTASGIKKTRRQSFKKSTGLQHQK